LVRSHSAWALGRIGSPSSASVLRARREVEVDPSVVTALDAALQAVDA
jgi:HEAT repeat protein